jgi:hypothetical protein
MDNHPSIEVVTQGDITDIDTREYPAYPLGNINILGSTFGINYTDWNIQLIIADKIKNKNNESEERTNAQTIPFYGVDDVVDIHANTLAIINDLTSYTQRSVDGFEINEDIICEPFMDRFNNGLAGWAVTFTLTVHNDRNRCLFELYPQTPTNTGSVTTTTTTTAAPATTTTTTTLPSGSTTTTTLAPLKLYSVRNISGTSTIDYVDCDGVSRTFQLNNGAVASRVASRIVPTNAEIITDLGVVDCDPCFNLVLQAGEADVSLCASAGVALTDRISTPATYCVKAVGQDGIGAFNWSFSSQCGNY